LGLPVVHLVMRRTHDWRQLPRFFRALRGRYDVVHIHSYRDYIVPAAAARLARIPAVVMTRHLPHPFRNRLTAYVCSKLFYDGIIAVSEFIRRILLDSSTAPERVFVVKNGIDLSPWQQVSHSNVRQELQIPEAAFLVVAAGRVVPEKGLDVLIRAIGHARAKGVDAICAIAGQGEDLGRLEKLRAELALDAAVQFLGFRRDVPALFAVADVIVVPSIWGDPFPYAVMEALGSGRPVIASQVGGIPEIMTPDTGYLTPPGDAERIARAIEALATDPGRRAAIGEAARRRAQDFSLDKCVQGIEAVYEALMRRTPGLFGGGPENSVPCRSDRTEQ
jgi:glycosyltransferase involved in cell wall biosynthesis